MQIKVGTFIFRNRPTRELLFEYNAKDKYLNRWEFNAAVVAAEQVKAAARRVSGVCMRVRIQSFYSLTRVWVPRPHLLLLRRRFSTALAEFRGRHSVKIAEHVTNSFGRLSGERRNYSGWADRGPKLNTS